MKLFRIIFHPLVLVVILMTGCGSKPTESTSSSSEKIELNADIASADLISKYLSVNEFDEFNDPGYQKIIVTIDRRVTNFEFIEVEYVEKDGSFQFNKKSVLYKADEFSPEKPFVVTWLEQGSIPHRGISFVDEKGITRSYFIAMSGKDDSLYLSEF